jgi:hypothetical protein
MVDQVPICVRYILPCWVVGMAMTMVLLAMVAGGVASRLRTVLLRPGLLLSEGRRRQ